MNPRDHRHATTKSCAIASLRQNQAWGCDRPVAAVVCTKQGLTVSFRTATGAEYLSPAGSQRIATIAQRALQAWERQGMGQQQGALAQET